MRKLHYKYSHYRLIPLNGQVYNILWVLSIMTALQVSTAIISSMQEKLLKHHCKYTVAEFSPSDWATTQAYLGDIFLKRLEQRKESIENAIVYYQESLQVFTLTAYSAEWAARQSDLCHAYWQRIEGDREQNMEQAIQHGQAALQIYTYEDTPDEWAEALLYIGTAYLSRISGEYRVNIESAINSFEQALRVYTHESEPFDWAEYRRS